FILLGGFIGPDGYVVSPGMHVLALRLRSLGEVSSHNWSARDDVAQRIAALSPNDKVVLIGYSGGGFAITEVAQALDRNPPHKVDLLIAVSDLEREISWQQRDQGDLLLQRSSPLFWAWEEPSLR